MARRKQPPLPGMEEQFITELDDVAQSYNAIKLKRCKLSKDEDEAKTLLIEKMIQHGQTRYKTSDDLIVDLLDKKTVKTTTAAKNADEDGED